MVVRGHRATATGKATSRRICPATTIAVSAVGTGRSEKSLSPLRDVFSNPQHPLQHACEARSSLEALARFGCTPHAGGAAPFFFFPNHDSLSNTRPGANPHAQVCSDGFGSTSPCTFIRASPQGQSLHMRMRWEVLGCRCSLSALSAQSTYGGRPINFANANW